LSPKASFVSQKASFNNRQQYQSDIQHIHNYNTSNMTATIMIVTEIQKYDNSEIYSSMTTIGQPVLEIYRL